MGACLSGCVSCATCIHDRYNSWRWTDQQPDFTNLELFTNGERGIECKSIHAAVIDKNDKEVRRMFQEDPSIGILQNSSGETALHLACKLGYRHIVEVLLDCRCTVRLRMCTAIGTPVHCVIKAYHSGYLTDSDAAELVARLANEGCNINTAADSGKKTALFYASELGALQCMRTLIKLGVPLNCQDSNGFSPLYMATMRGDLPMVCLLLRQLPRIDVNLPDSMGRTPLMAGLITITNNFREGLSYVGYKIDAALNDSSRFNGIAIVEALLRAGADPNIMDNHDRTALVIAFAMLEMDHIHVESLYRGSSLHLMTKSSSMVESIYAPLVRLLVLSDGRFPDNWSKDYSRTPAAIVQLYAETLEAREQSLVQRPSKLVHLCRLAIRAHMAAVGRLHHLEEVPVPQNLKGYLQVRYL